MGLASKVKLLVRGAISPFYWSAQNLRHGHQVESHTVSFGATIGRRSIIRRGAEVERDVVLGDYSYISGPRTYVESARIGKFCSIARQTVIGVSGKDTKRVTTHNFITAPGYGDLATTFHTPAQKAPPVIGNDVWIGINAVIMRGVTIGDGAVIGANSVVSSDVPPYAIVGGNPARKIRDRFRPEQIASLQKIRWWDWPEEKLRERATLFLNLDAFLDAAKND